MIEKDSKNNTAEPNVLKTTVEQEKFNNNNLQEYADNSTNYNSTNNKEKDSDHNLTNEKFDNNFDDNSNIGPSEETIDELDLTIEKQNYTKYSFKKLQKLRVNGAAFGIDIPPLNCNLQKPDKPRTVFKVYSIISICMLVICSIATLWASSAFIYSLVVTIGQVNQSTNTTASILTFGLVDIFAGTATLLLWAIIIIIIALLIMLIVYLSSFVREFSNFSKCSIQEMAIGYQVKDFKRKTIVIMTLSVLGICGIIYSMIKNQTSSLGHILSIVVLTLITLYTVSMLVFVILEQNNAEALFDQLPGDEQENFRAHNTAVGEVKHKMKSLRKGKKQEYWNFY